MEENEAVDQQGLGAATPIFSVYRRGYDPEQVDRYVAEQQRRLDETTHRASESERKLAAAVGQLRELHRRVAVYESEARSTQPPALDTLGERVQRILQEAWEGAYNLRQEAEREVNELKDQTQREVAAQREQAQLDVEELQQVASREAADLVDEATRRALALRDEMDRRRSVYLEKVERDRQRAVSQITFLYDQRQLALSELARLQTAVQATVEEMVRSPLGKPAAAIADSAAMRGLRTSSAGEVEPRAESELELGFEPEPPIEVPARGDLERDVMTMGGAVGAEVVAGDLGKLGELGQLDIDADGDGMDAGVVDAGVGVRSVFVEAPDARATGEYLASDPGVPSWGAERVVAPPAEETPTGPMSAVDYGYDHSSYSNRPAHSYSTGRTAEDSEDAGAAGAADGVDGADGADRADHDRASTDGKRGNDGVFDAEVDGWG